MTTRAPAVAGMFYPDDPVVLRTIIQKFLQPEKKQETIHPTLIILPHAGYKYSGHVAGATLARTELGKRFLVLGPNHTGRGHPLSMNMEGTWRTPLGEASIDADLARTLKNACPQLMDDAMAHLQEHSLEVEIPFLQERVPEMSFVPICLGYVPFEVCQELGSAIAAVLRQEKIPVQIVASTDFNHYENQEITEQKDQWAIDCILARDPQGLYRTIREKQISMCGIIPTTVALVAANELGATKAELVRHATSGDVTGEYGAVVGYGGLLIS